MLYSAAGVLAILSIGPMSITALVGGEAFLPGLETAKSFLAMMDDRSPGDRTAAELIKTKKKARSEPQQRALGKIAPAPPEDFVAAIAPPPPELAELPPFAAALSELGPLLAVAPPPPPVGAFVTPPGPPPPGGGTPPPTIDNPPPENPPPENPPPAVPEPGTWATMLMGFGLTGWLIRRRRRTPAVPQRA